ncbi:MAG: phosphatase PAP2 family protein [Legionella sp.]|nr:phosphatase PAP2 family protein [Legionella sp.]
MLALSRNYSFRILSSFFWFFIVLLWAINYCYFKFPGNNYLPGETPLVAAVLSLVLLGSYLQFGPQSRCFYGLKKLSGYFFVIITIALGTNVVQYTPHVPVDVFLLSIEKKMGVNLVQLMAWTAEHPLFKKILVDAYNSLPYQMGWLPVLVLLLRGFEEVQEYCVLLLATTLLGFVIYYCYPTLGPASLLKSPYFFPEQYDTGIKFKEIHAYLSPTTIYGGMIAFPSFHVIWACLCLYLVRHWIWLFLPLGLLNVLLIASCVLLGWHYVIDVIGSFLILIIVLGSYRMFCIIHWSTSERSKARSENHTAI